MTLVTDGAMPWVGRGLGGKVARGRDAEFSLGLCSVSSEGQEAAGCYV